MNTKTEFEIPKVFWKFYDEYRRNVISLSEFSRRSGLSIAKIKVCLEAL